MSCVCFLYFQWMIPPLRPISQAHPPDAAHAVNDPTREPLNPHPTIKPEHGIARLATLNGAGLQSTEGL